MWVAVEKDGIVYVHYMHNQASAMAITPAGKKLTSLKR
jgi:hypothetical protein